MYGAHTYAGGDNNNNREAIFQITSTKLYVPVFTLSTKDNENLTKQLDEGFKRSVYWNEYQSKIETKTADNSKANLKKLFVSYHPHRKKKVTRAAGKTFFLPYSNYYFLFKMLPSP